jgi:hypothetical protein
MPQLSEWLQIMLGEIARKQEEARRAKEDERSASSTPAKPTIRSQIPIKRRPEHSMSTAHVCALCYIAV